MKIQKNILLQDEHGKPIATDIFFEETGKSKPVIIYAHGFNGFKDWGSFDIMAKRIAEAGFVLIKFNFSFNGTTPAQAEEFTDLEAYAQNNYTIELDNLEAVINWAVSPDNPYASEIDQEMLGLIGHSLGGGIVLLKAAEDARVKALVTWAAIAECQTPWSNWPKERMKEWEETGVQHIVNGRTGQQMPLGYQLYENYQQNKERLNIKRAIKSLNIPILLCHGTNDPAVPIAKARLLQEWQPAALLFTIASDHVFGRKHPWEGNELPEPMEVMLNATISFFRKEMLT